MKYPKRPQKALAEKRLGVFGEFASYLEVVEFEDVLVLNTDIVEALPHTKVFCSDESPIANHSMVICRRYGLALLKQSVLANALSVMLRQL